MSEGKCKSSSRRRLDTRPAAYVIRSQSVREREKQWGYRELTASRSAQRDIHKQTHTHTHIHQQWDELRTASMRQDPLNIYYYSILLVYTRFTYVLVTWTMLVWHLARVLLPTAIRLIEIRQVAGGVHWGILWVVLVGAAPSTTATVRSFGVGVFWPNVRIGVSERVKRPVGYTNILISYSHIRQRI